MRLFQRKHAAPRQTLTLQEALRQGLVTFELRGAGEGVTARVRLTLTKLTDDPLTIRIPRGTEFVPVDRTVSQ